MKNYQPAVKWFLLIIVLLLSVVACGPSTEPEDGDSGRESGLFPVSGSGQRDESTAVDTTTTEEESGNAGNPSATAVDEGSVTVDKNGIEVGFTEDGHPYRGNRNAPVVIEEYSDYQCPYCARFTEQTMPALLENQIANGTAVVIFYDFPLRNIHPQAASAANAARCAGEQSAAAYWDMHDMLFDNLGDWEEGKEVYIEYASDLALDVANFEECVNNQTHIEAVLADIEDGISRGVSSTPSFFVNNQPLIGAQPLAVFDQAIAAAASGEPVAQQQQEAPQPGIKPTPASIPTNNVAGAMGDPNAPITIVEYTDYQCPYCQRHSVETMPTILTNMIETGQVYYMLKDFPLDNIHPEARTAAAAARCAGEQEAYWDMHDAIFRFQSDWAGSNAAMELMAEIAIDLGLDSDALIECINSDRYAADIQNNLDEGISLGVQGTPHFFIEGFPISGAQPYDLFEYAISLANEGTLADAYVRDEPEPDPQPTGPVDVPLGDAYTIGDPDAPVTIVEYTDFQCPFCSRHFQQTFSQIKTNYIDTGLVRYVFKDFPLTSIHPQAVQAAEAARCAGDQGAYVEMHQTLFNKQSEWGNSAAEGHFNGYATDLGLDTSVFSDCLASKKYETAVYEDLDEGIGFGVTGTPAFFLNGYFLSGAQPYNVFDDAINSLLSDQ